MTLSASLLPFKGTWLAQRWGVLVLSLTVNVAPPPNWDNLVVKSVDQRQLVKPLKPIHLEYLRALNVSPNVFCEP